MDKSVDIDPKLIRSLLGYDGSKEETIVFIARNLLHALQHYHSEDDLAGEVIDWANLLEKFVGLGPNPYE